jgi:hypothetical protein
MGLIIALKNVIDRRIQKAQRTPLADSEAAAATS